VGDGDVVAEKPYGVDVVAGPVDRRNVVVAQAGLPQMMGT
jgi:hypothetical protein